MHTFSTALKKIVDADLSLSNAGIMVISLRSTEDLTSLCPLSSGARNVHSLLARRVEKMNSKESKCPLFKILENGENELNGIKMSTLYELGEIGEKELNGREMSTPYELGESGEKELNGRDVSTLYGLGESGENELNRIEVSTLYELEGVEKMNSTRQAIKEASNCA